MQDVGLQHIMRMYYNTYEAISAAFSGLPVSDNYGFFDFPEIFEIMSQ